MSRSRMVWGLFLVILLAAAPIAIAEDFRIETHLFSGAEGPSPVATTLFYEGDVFDYLELPDALRDGDTAVTGEVTVFQPLQKQFVVLSVHDQMFTILTFGEIDAELEKMRIALRREAKRLANLNDARANKQARYFAFLADPRFTEQYDDQNGVLLLESEFLTYRIETDQTRRPGTVDQVREFTDWQAKLNYLLHGTLPPGPRLHVNANLAKRNRIAKAVTLTISTADQPVRIHAKHELDPTLRSVHVQRIQTTNSQQQGFESVAFSEYQRRRAMTQQAANKKRSRRK